MTIYSLLQPFTLEDARALAGKYADITVETDAETGETETHSDTPVLEVYQKPGTSRAYLAIGRAIWEPGVTRHEVMYVPLGDVRGVDGVREL